MRDEPVFKRLVMGFVRRKQVEGSMKQPPEQLSAEIVTFARERGLPLDEVRETFADYLAQRSDQVSVFKRFLQSRRQRVLQQLAAKDAEVLEALFKRQASAIRAWTDLQGAAHDANRTPKRLSQGAELEDLQHETRVLEERTRQAELRMKGLDRKRQRIQFREEIEQLRRKKQDDLEKSEAPAVVYDKWGELLRFFKTEVIGADDFMSAAEEALAEFEAKRRGGIAEDDPRREIKVVQLTGMLDQMRKTRDQIVRDMWGKK